MTQDKLSHMLQLQSEFQKNFYDIATLADADRVRQTKENMLALHRELGEALNEMPWKHHRANSQSYDITKVQEELIDCIKFMMNICLLWGLDADTMYSKFVEKTRVVQTRYDKEKDRIPTALDSNSTKMGYNTDLKN